MKWGDWTLNPNTRQLVYDDGNVPSYEVNIDDMSSSARTLDWIYQLHGKTWMTPKGIHDLLTAIEDIIGVQGNLCSGGVDHVVNAKAFVDDYIADPGLNERLFGS
jgi:hypothetical protein